MNKQEAIKRIEQMGEYERFVDEPISKASVLSIVSQIHKPQKVVVPKFVAEYIEECKRSGWHLQKVLSNLDDDEKVGDWAYGENDDLIPEKVDMIARACLDGYEVEKEQLYTVEIPNPNRKGTNRFYLFKDVNTGKVMFGKGKFNPCKNQTLWLTEAEIKQDFEWAWDAGFYEPVEVE